MDTFKSGKRGRVESDSDSEEEVFVCDERKMLEGAWPRFWMVREADEGKPLSKLSPFAIAKCFEGISPRLVVKRLRDGAFLVECPTEKDSRALQKRDKTIFVDRHISVTVHRSLNSSRGVIRCPELADMPDSEILKELTTQGVSEVKRVLVTKGPKKIPTNTLFLTFAMAKLPESIRIGYLRVKVTPFIPSPLRCFRCQKFGHGSKACKLQEACRDCGKAKHEGPCEAPKHCVNCEGEHSSNSRDCPKWKLEQTIQKVRTEERCSFAEAKRRVMATMPNTSHTFADAVKSPQEGPAETACAPAHITKSLEALIAGLTTAVQVLTKRVESLEKMVGARSGTPPSPVNTVAQEAAQKASNGQTAPSNAVNLGRGRSTSGPRPINPSKRTAATAVVRKPSPSPSQKTAEEEKTHGAKAQMAAKPQTFVKPGPACTKKLDPPGTTTRNRFQVLEVDMAEEEQGRGENLK
jgi:hypothetical protein